MFDSLGQFVFNIALIGSAAFIIMISLAIRFVFKRGWPVSVVLGTILGIIIGYIVSPHIFYLYIDLRGLSL